jgi:hypothetical protein
LDRVVGVGKIEEVILTMSLLVAKDEISIHRKGTIVMNAKANNRIVNVIEAAFFMIAPCLRTL